MSQLAFFIKYCYYTTDYGFFLLSYLLKIFTIIVSIDYTRSVKSTIFICSSRKNIYTYLIKYASVQHAVKINVSFSKEYHDGNVGFDGMIIKTIIFSIKQISCLLDKCDILHKAYRNGLVCS
jgi:hypothetical protein